ncbi:hypothetical protein LMG27174_06982 [Paraburkholderia rhynchosiae]|uniref:Uncharacterized protein n=1 Tax=Paraburkholderia rhynchosiae TaxID=487049 RepID=A0A6J5CTL7_9BURK|nr:hypothetical protein LMG27174_06982 [Paraburkholderia rhynchosiae]
MREAACGDGERAARQCADSGRERCVKLISMEHWTSLSILSLLAEVMRQQATGSNIHCGTSSKPAVWNGSRAQRRIDSPFFLSIVVKIHTVCPYHGCQRYRTSLDSLIWALCCRLVQSRPSSLDVGLRQPDAVRAGLVRRPEPTGGIISAQLRDPKFAGNVSSPGYMDSMIHGLPCIGAGASPGSAISS